MAAPPGAAASSVSDRATAVSVVPAGRSAAAGAVCGRAARVWTAAGQPAAALLPLPDEPVEELDDAFAGADSFDGEEPVEDDSFDDDSFDDDDELSAEVFAPSPEEELERLSVR